MRPREVIVHADAALLAQAVAARLLTRLLDVQSVRRPAHVGVTGGTIGIDILAAVAASPLRDAVDWTGVHVWWGDERFLPAGDPERNETLARRAMLDPLASALPAENVHPMPAADTPGIDSPEDAAAAYARELAAFAEGPGGGVDVPAFDVLLFGMGPDGHVASLFPGNPALDAVGTTVVGVHGSPKPPPERISFSFDAIRAAREVWIVAAGASKRHAVTAALGGESAEHLPVVGAVGRERTLWLIDADATPPG